MAVELSHADGQTDGRTDRQTDRRDESNSSILKYFERSKLNFTLKSPALHCKYGQFVTCVGKQWLLVVPFAQTTLCGLCGG